MLTTKILKYPQNLDECFSVRYKVFIDEQKFEEDIEIDELDNVAYHVLIKDNNVPIATARFFKKDDYYKVGRVCVLKEYRGLKIGNKIMDEIYNEIKKINGNKIVLSSQYHAKVFYEKNGYTVEGKIYLEEGVKHVKMFKKIK